MQHKGKIKVTKNGPYLVTGKLPIIQEDIVRDAEGEALAWKKIKQYPEQEQCALCRCGGSKNKPFCDGTHAQQKFEGLETATDETYKQQAELTSGPELDLWDAPKLCSGAGFCHRAGGTWDLTEHSDDPKKKQQAIQQACCCPSGRLVAQEKNGVEIEISDLEVVSVTEDSSQNISGPLWVKGGVELESSTGKKYESRKRVTLCRCGKSKNKPFCDGGHV